MSRDGDPLDLIDVDQPVPPPETTVSSGWSWPGVAAVAVAAAVVAATVTAVITTRTGARSTRSSQVGSAFACNGNLTVAVTFSALASDPVRMYLRPGPGIEMGLDSDIRLIHGEDASDGFTVATVYRSDESGILQLVTSENRIDDVGDEVVAVLRRPPLGPVLRQVVLPVIHCPEPAAPVARP